MASGIALIAVLVQLELARRDRKRARVQHRYEELVKVCDHVSRILARVIARYRTFTVTDEGVEVDATVAELTTAAHAMGLLRMHQVPDAIFDPVEVFLKVYQGLIEAREAARTDEELVAATKRELAKLDAALKLFEEAAGLYLSALWPRAAEPKITEEAMRDSRLRKELAKGSSDQRGGA